MTALASGQGGRFTIGDVTAQPVLVTAAAEFIKGYRGDFEFLVRMKEVFQMSGRFTDGQTKGVLNCMVYDPEGMRHLHNISRPVGENGPAFIEGPMGGDGPAWTGPRPGLRLVTEPEPPEWFEVRAVFKRFWLTTEVQGRSHFLDVDRCKATYFREAHRIDFQMVTLCGLRHRSIRLYGPRREWSLTEHATKPTCQSCERKFF